jgi:hypothetical protein
MDSAMLNALMERDMRSQSGNANDQWFNSGQTMNPNGQASQGMGEDQDFQTLQILSQATGIPVEILVALMDQAQSPAMTGR